MAQRTSERTIRIPIKISDGRIMYLYGGALPELLDCSFGEIVLPESAVKDPAARARLNGEKVVPFLPGGTELRLRISKRPAPATLEQHVVGTVVYALGNCRTVSFSMKEPLALRWRGAKWPTLEPAACHIPSLPGAAAESVNHACRLISEAFEPHRRSHAANVFNEVFADDGRFWTTLDELRGRIAQSLEASLSAGNDGGQATSTT